MTWSWLDSARTATPELIILLRLVMASVLGGLVGFDRQRKDKPAGLRTHMLIALAAALYAIITIEVIHDPRLSGGRESSSDPVRIIEAVTAGVAFLAAGTIVLQGRGVIGITTGASMWTVAGLGVACGLGDYSVAIMAAALTLVILAIISHLEIWIEKSPEARQGSAAGDEQGNDGPADRSQSTTDR